LSVAHHALTRGANVQLSFLAREDQLVRVPGIGRGAVGQPVPYVGRVFDAKTRGYPATEEPYVVDADSDSGRRLAELCRRDQSLWPANKETAEACGVEFVAVSFDAGVWARKAALVSARRASASASSEGSAA
jgi:hypothetical protein